VSSARPHNRVPVHDYTEATSGRYQNALVRSPEDENMDSIFRSPARHTRRCPFLCRPPPLRARVHHTRLPHSSVFCHTRASADRFAIHQSRPLRSCRQSSSCRRPWKRSIAVKRRSRRFRLHLVPSARRPSRKRTRKSQKRARTIQSSLQVGPPNPNPNHALVHTSATSSLPFVFASSPSSSP